MEMEAFEAATPGESGFSRRWKITAIVAALLAVTALHYLTPPAHFAWHVLYQNLYYVPVLLGAFWFGLSGGLAAAVAAAALYTPHVLLQWGHEPFYRLVQLAAIALFLFTGALAGWLIDRVRREREVHRRVAEERDRAYRQLRATFDRLRLVDRLSALGALSAGMAHEIRNPLGSISGAIEILRDGVPGGDPKREFVEILYKEVQRLSTIVSRHLDLVRPARPERAPHDPGEIVRSVVDLATKEAARQGVELVARVADDLSIAMVDGQQVRQAVLNLVLNAVQALPGGGHVWVAACREGDGIAVAVEDDGPGFDREARGRAFEPFFTTKEGGTGLGLSICFQIAAGHGGDLRIEDRPGGGARVVLALPLRPPDTADAPGADSTPGERSAARRKGDGS